MIEITYYYDGTEDVIELGHKVSWRYEDEDKSGVVTELDEMYFWIDWKDIGKRRYPIDKIAGLMWVE